MKKWLALVLLAFLATGPSAEEYYLSGGVDYTKVNISDTSFNPVLSRIKFGVTAVESTTFRGIGLELVAGQSVRNDTVEQFDLDIGQHWGVYGTFAAPDLGSLKFVINLGYTSTEIEGKSETLNTGFVESVEGFSYGFSFQQSIEMLPELKLSLDCTQYYSDDNVEMAGCGLGAMYEF